MYVKADSWSSRLIRWVAQSRLIGWPISRGGVAGVKIVVDLAWARSHGRQNSAAKSFVWKFQYRRRLSIRDASPQMQRADTVQYTRAVE